jgi:hypothetical protein
MVGGLASRRSEDNECLPSSVKVKNGWTYTSTTPYVFMTCIETLYKMLSLLRFKL